MSEKEQVHNPFWCLVESLESRPIILWPPDFFRHYVLDVTPDKDETEKRLAVKAKG